MSDPMVIKKELLFNEYTWCEDGNCLEWIDGMISNPDDHHRIPCNLEDAFEIARKQKAVLVIQPENQEQCIFADFTDEDQIMYLVKLIKEKKNYFLKRFYPLFTIFIYSTAFLKA